MDDKKKKGGRPAALSPIAVKYIRDNPDKLSNKELAAKYKVTPLTIIRAKKARGSYAVA